MAGCLLGYNDISGVPLVQARYMDVSWVTMIFMVCPCACCVHGDMWNAPGSGWVHGVAGCLLGYKDMLGAPRLGWVYGDLWDTPGSGWVHGVAGYLLGHKDMWGAPRLGWVHGDMWGAPGSG